MTKKSLYRRLRFTHMDNLPIGLSCHRVHILLAQETYVIGLLQLLDGTGKGVGLTIVEPDCPHVLVATMNGLDFTIAPEILRHLRSSHAQRKEDEKDRNDKAD